MQKYKKIDHYQLLEILGKGANGLVYKGLNTLNGSLVAIKQMIIGKSQIKAIKAQLNILKQLDHPSIVKYIDAVQKQNKIYLILQYMEGGSLGALVRKSPIEQDVAKIFVKQILNGLVFLHNSQVIHRDIKGANLLLTKNGHVKLADFGVAVRLEDGQKTISAAGSPYWMAPQIISSDTEPSSKCDIWSLGCTAIQLLTGNPPYFDLMQFPALFRIVEDKHPPLPQCSQQCRQFLLSCFIKNPKQRPSASELLNSNWLKTTKQTPELKSLKQQVQIIEKHIKNALFPNINYPQLEKILKQTKNSELICSNKYFLSVIQDNRQIHPNYLRIQLIINMIRTDKSCFQILNKTGIFHQQFQKLRQKYEPSQEYIILYYKLIATLVQLYCITYKQIQNNSQLGHHNLMMPNIQLIQVTVLHKCLPSLAKLLNVLNNYKKFEIKYDLLRILNLFITTFVNRNGEQQCQQTFCHIIKVLQQYGQLKQISTLNFQVKNDKQSNLDSLKLQTIVKLLPALVFMLQLKPNSYKKSVYYLITQLISIGFLIQNQSVLITKIMCLSILAANNSLKSYLENNGIIYYLCQFYGNASQNMGSTSVAALLQSFQILKKMMENSLGGIDKNRVIQFDRNHGIQYLQKISHYVQYQNKNKKKQTGTLFDKISQIIAILQNYRF